MLSFLRLTSPVPTQYRSNFRHLYFDIAWYGVLNSSALAFLAVYAARQGGNALQIGLLTAGPAIVNLVVAIPISHWLRARPTAKAVFWASLVHRIFYLFWIPLPMLLAPEAQVWTLIGLTIAMSVPGAGLAIGFNALFGEAVPIEWRGHVAGIRNALLSVTSVVGSLICGRILTGLSFPLGYQVVFAIGAVAALMSSLHFWYVRPLLPRPIPARTDHSVQADVQPDEPRRPLAALRYLMRQVGVGLLRVEILKGPFVKVLAVLFVFHISQYLTVPVVPVFMVNSLHLADQQIGLATAIFWFFTFAGSLALASLTRRMGNQWVTGVGVVLMGLYPGFMALSAGLGTEFVMIASATGGVGYALMIGAFLNYILERVPQDDRPAHLAWYNIAFNAAILIGSVIGPFVASHIGFTAALAAFAFARFAAGWLIVKRG
jgi:MFS family permease